MGLSVEEETMPILQGFVSPVSSEAPKEFDGYQDCSFGLSFRIYETGREIFAPLRFSLLRW